MAHQNLYDKGCHKNALLIIKLSLVESRGFAEMAMHIVKINYRKRFYHDLLKCVLKKIKHPRFTVVNVLYYPYITRNKNII